MSVWLWRAEALKRDKTRGRHTDEGVKVGGGGDASGELSPGALEDLEHEVGLQVGAQVRHLIAQPLQVLQHPIHCIRACTHELAPYCYCTLDVGLEILPHSMVQLCTSMTRHAKSMNIIDCPTERLSCACCRQILMHGFPTFQCKECAYSSAASLTE